MGRDRLRKQLGSGSLYLVSDLHFSGVAGSDPDQAEALKTMTMASPVSAWLMILA